MTKITQNKVMESVRGITTIDGKMQGKFSSDKQDGLKNKQGIMVNTGNKTIMVHVGNLQELWGGFLSVKLKYEMQKWI